MSSLVCYNPDQVAGKALCRLLKKRDLKPIYQDNWEEIIEDVRFGTPGVLVLDLGSLAEIAARVREVQDVIHVGDPIPIIMLTPFASDEVEMQPFHEFGYLILEKPVAIEKLVDAINRSVIGGTQP